MDILRGLVCDDTRLTDTLEETDEIKFLYSTHFRIK